MPDSMDFSRKPVLVLGASGFIGSRVVAALSHHPLYRAVPASRHSGLRIDGTNSASVRAALQDVHYVINCIAGGAMVPATRVLCDAARALPPRRIVHLSSMAVYGAATGTITEDQAPVEPIGLYGRAKIECERLVRKYVDDGGDAVILRPTCVFGPGSPQWTIRLVRLLRDGRIGDLGAAGDGWCNLAFIDDVVAAIVSALDAPGITGRVFNISSNCELTWNEFFKTFGQELGAVPIRRLSARRLQIETQILAPVRRVMAMAVRSPWTEAVTPSLAALWRQDIRIDCAAARRLLVLPATSVDEMIGSVVRAARVAKEPSIS
jgi:2-alkyl-3-oxoalkanoate reductase